MMAGNEGARMDTSLVLVFYQDSMLILLYCSDAPASAFSHSSGLSRPACFRRTRTLYGLGLGFRV